MMHGEPLEVESLTLKVSSLGVIPTMDGQPVSEDLETDAKTSPSQELSPEQRARLEEAIQKCPFTKDGRIGCTSLMKHDVDVGDTRPIKQRFYPVSPAILKDLDTELMDRLLKMGVIERSQRSWSNPVVVVRKPSGKIRMCLDFRKVNKATKKDAHPMPLISDIFLKNVHY
jgi:hypothetical protein